MLNSSDFYRQQMSTANYKNYIETASGARFYVDEPIFIIEDAAHALGNQCRFMGHISKFYSVAEHCCLVATLMKYFKLGDPKEGLLHDAHEAYCVDMAAPWKVELPEYKAFERKFELPFRRQFGLSDTISPGCKRADWIALFVEAEFLMPSKAADWIIPDETMRVDAQAYAATISYNDIGWSPETASRMFLDYYAQVQK